MYTEETLSIKPQTSSKVELDYETERLTTKLIYPEHNKKAESLFNVNSDLACHKKAQPMPKIKGD